MKTIYVDKVRSRWAFVPNFLQKPRVELSYEIPDDIAAFISLMRPCFDAILNLVNCSSLEDAWQNWDNEMQRSWLLYELLGELKAIPCLLRVYELSRPPNWAERTTDEKFDWIWCHADVYERPKSVKRRYLELWPSLRCLLEESKDSRASELLAVMDE